MPHFGSPYDYATVRAYHEMISNSLYQYAIAMQLLWLVFFLRWHVVYSHDKIVFYLERVCLYYVL